MTKVVFFGDSICLGHMTSVCNTWISMVSRSLYEKNSNIIVSNSSINGDTTRLALERMFHDVLDHSPDIVYIQFGLNDCNYWTTDNGVPRVSKAAFEANLCEMIDKCFVAHVTNIILGTNHPIVKDIRLIFKSKINENIMYPLSLEKYNQEYNAIIRNVAIRKNVLLADHSDYWLKHYIESQRKTFLFPDGVHINERGHLEYYNLVYPIIKEELNNLW